MRQTWALRRAWYTLCTGRHDAEKYARTGQNQAQVKSTAEGLAVTLRAHNGRQIEISELEHRELGLGLKQDVFRPANTSENGDTGVSHPFHPAVDLLMHKCTPSWARACIGMVWYMWGSGGWVDARVYLGKKRLEK